MAVLRLTSCTNPSFIVSPDPLAPDGLFAIIILNGWIGQTRYFQSGAIPGVPPGCYTITEEVTGGTVIDFTLNFVTLSSPSTDCGQCIIDNPPIQANCDHCDEGYDWQTILEPEYYGDCETTSGPHKHCYNSCTVFFTTRLAVYSYNFYTGEYTKVLDVSGHVDTNITTGTVYENKYWIVGSNGDGFAIREYDITFSPRSYIGITPLPILLTLNRTLFNPSHIVPLTAKNNTLLLGGTTTLEQYDVTGLTPVVTPIFTLLDSGIINRALYIPGINHVYITGNDSLGSFIGEYELTGSPTPIWRITLPSGNYCGIYSDYLGNLYVTTGIPGGTGNSVAQYLIDIVGNTIVPIANLPFPGNVGGTQSPTCSQRNAEYWSATLVCECAEPLCYYFASPNVEFLEGLSAIPLLTTFAGLDSACWDLRYAGGFANVPEGCLEYIDGNLLTLSDVTSITQQQCEESCTNRIVGNTQLTSCCNGQVIIVKSNIQYPGTYSIQELAVLYPWAGNCWEASQSTNPQWELDISTFDVITQSVCSTCAGEEVTSEQVPCNCPQPICYELIPCPGEIVVSIIATNDLSAYVGSTVMVDGICYTVQPGSENCLGGQVVEIFDSFAQCGDQTGQPDTAGCKYCDCPPGYYPNEYETECLKTDCVTPTLNGTFYPITATDGGPDNTWGDEGTRIYEDIIGKIFPIATELPDNPPTWAFKENDGTGAALTWVAPVLLNAFINRFSNVAIWPAANPINEWVGITACVNITEEKVYSIGVSADSQFVVKHNGVEILKDITTGVNAYRVWHIFQITLPVGQHVFEFFALNLGGTGGLGFEIYNATGLTLQTISPASLPGVILFSTQTLQSQVPQQNFLLGDNAYACPDGYFLNNCDGNPMCCKVPKVLPFVHCEPSYLVENCTGEIPPVITNTDLSSLVGKISRICITSSAPPDPYTDCQLCDPEYTWEPRPVGNAYEGDCRTPDNGNPYQHCYNPCTIFLNGKKGEIYSRNPYSGLTIQIGNLAGTMSSNSNIANTADKLWVLGVTNLILEYVLVLSPLGYSGGTPNPIQLVFNTSYPPSVPSLMFPRCAVNNNLLLGGGTAVIEYDISGPTVVFNTLFALPNAGVIQDLVYLPLSNTILILGTDSIGPFVGHYTYAGTELNRAALSFSDFITILVTPEGYVQVVRGNNPNDIYNINLTPTWSQGAIVNTINGVNVLGGGSQNPTCTNLGGAATIWPAGCYCIKVTEIPFDPAGVPWSYSPTIEYDDCDTCLIPCYALTSCPVEGVEPTVIIVNNDLDQFLGQVVKFPRLGDGCWIVSSVECDGSAITVPGGYSSFDTCELCNPVIPPPPITTCRTVKPGYDTPGCSIEYTERVSCTFGRQAFDEMVQSRYGIKICCDHEMNKWDVRWEILKLKMIFDPTLCETIVPSPSITLTYTTSCLDGVTTINLAIEVYCGSGSYILQEYTIQKIWINYSNEFTGPVTGNMNRDFIAAGDENGRVFRVLDTVSCSLVSNSITLEIPECLCVPAIDSSGTFSCIDPPNGQGEVVLTNTYSCSSGDYSLQIYNTKTEEWETVNTYASVTEGNDSQLMSINNPSTVTYLARVIDNVLGTISNIFQINTTNCPEVETIILNSVAFTCTPGEDGDLTGNFTVTNGTGNYELQINLNGLWANIYSILGSTTGVIDFTYTLPGGTIIPGNYEIRIQDSINFTTSNTLPITISSCPDEVLTIDRVEPLYCNPINGNLIGSFTWTITNPQGQVNLEYYNGFNWILAVASVGNGGPYLQILPNDLCGQLDTSFRLHDVTSGMYSAEYPVFGLIPICTWVNIDQITSAEIIGLFNMDITYVNAYEVTNPLFVDLEESLFPGGPFVVILNTLGILSNPENATHMYFNINLTSGLFYRIRVNDSLGLPVYSSEVICP